MKLKDISTTCKKRFLQRRFDITLRIEASCSAEELAGISFKLYSFTRDLAPDGAEINNIKGISDELFSFSALIPTTEEEIYKKYGHPITVSISTRFEKLKDAGTLIHSTQEHVSGSIPPSILPKEVLSLAPIFPKECKFGVETFAPHYFSMSLGFAPTIRDSISIVSSDQKLVAIFQGINLDKFDAPIGSAEIWNKCQKIFLEEGNLHIGNLFSGRISERQGR